MAQTPHDYESIFKSMTPIFEAGVFIGFVFGSFRTLGTQYSWLVRVSGALLASAIGGIVGVIACLATPYFVQDSTPELEIVVASIAAALGSKTLDLIVRKVLGYGIVDLKNIEAFRESLSADLKNKKEQLSTCRYRPTEHCENGGECNQEQCPHAQKEDKNPQQENDKKTGEKNEH